MNPLTIRKWHAYLGMFISPGVLFFSLTGAVQLFNLHEAHGNYHPPALLEKLGKLHKDQVIEQNKVVAEDAPAVDPDAATSVAHDAAPVAAGSQEHAHHHEQKLQRVNVYLLKWFCLFVALGLATSTAFGIWMGLQQTLRRRTHVILLMVGAVVPLLLILT